MTYFRFKSISILNFMKNKVSVNALHFGSVGKSVKRMDIHYSN